ncbi:MAG TPA: hypothetical protein VJ044_17560 [Candidatus Hodarchaeales archaeon]|nr:hypothetical protein [Candidatus Hodarchaeales archaeon]
MIIAHATFAHVKHVKNAIKPNTVAVGVHKERTYHENKMDFHPTGFQRPTQEARAISSDRMGWRQKSNSNHETARDT